jgi:hypothetical protein
MRPRELPPQPASRSRNSDRRGGIVEILQDLTLDTLDVPRPPPAAISKSIYYIPDFWWT